MLYTARDVRPGAVILTQRHIVATKGADYEAGLTGVGLGAVAGIAGARH